MYIIQRKQNDGLYYYTYDGWCRCTDDNGVLDIKDVVRFTHGERVSNGDLLGPNESFQWYGSYK